ncbi:MAG: hypothetical protein IJY89_07075 [Clostridia bacterium]|nr:hypothetical protein [Clostridia bacterium]
MSKIKKANEKIEEKVVEGYKKIEGGVVEGYKKIENGTVEGFKKVSDKCVDLLFTRKGEMVEDAKKRPAGKKEADDDKQ